MSPSIDNRVVEMEFDNKDFETGVGTTVKSLDKLKKGLDLTESTKSLNGLSAASKGFSLTSVADGIGTIANRFSTLGIIGMTVLQNLTNSAINLGRQMLNAIVLAPLKGGFAEYEQGINAFQTIMSNTKTAGATMQDVTDALAEMNVYANKTIYSFGDMTKAMGLFTAQGVNLKDSQAGIKGIFNLISLTGGDANKANSAIYQLSQAIASGTVRAQDWISVINAGIGGTDFQNQLKQTARVHGVAVDAIIKKEGSFRESLSKGWLSSAILLETLKQYTGDLSAEQLKSTGYTEAQIKQIQELGNTANTAATRLKTYTQVMDTLKSNLVTGWAASFKIIFGGLDEAANFWTEFGNAASNALQISTDARNGLLQGWKDLHGRTLLVEALRKAIYQIGAVLNIAKAGFTDVIKPLKAWDLWKVTYGLLKFSESLVVMRKYSVQIRNTFRGVGAIFSIVGMAVSALAKGFVRLLKALAPAAVGILNMSSSVGEWLLNLQKTIAANDIFNKAIEKMAIFLSNVKDAFKRFIGTITIIFSEIRTNISNMFKGTDLSGITALFDRIKARLAPFTKKDGVVNSNKSGNFLSGIIAGITTFIQNIIKAIDGMITKITPGLKKVGEFFKTLFTNLGKALSNQAKDIDFNTVFDAISTGFISGLIVAIIRFMNSGATAFGDLSGFFKTLATTFKGAAGILDAVRSSIMAWQQNIKAGTLLKIAGAVALLAAALVVLSLINSEKLAVASGAITLMFAELVGSLALLQKVSGTTGLIKTVASMIALANGVFVMSLALFILAKLDPDNLSRALLALTVMMTSIIAFTLALSKINIKKLLGNDSGIVLLAVAIQILTASVAKLGELDVDVLKRGLTGLSAILLALAATVKIINGAKLGIGTAVSLLALGAAFLIFSKAVEQLGKLSVAELARGLGAMAASLLLVAVAVKLMPAGQMIIAGVGLLLVSAALVVLSKSLAAMGNMSWDEIARGLVALAGSLTILTIAMYAMTGAIVGAAAMLIVAGAIAILVPALIMLGALPFKVIGVALLALVGIFAVIGVAALVMAPIIPLILALAAALALLGIATLAVGVGLLAAATGLAILATLGAAGAMGLVLVIKLLLGLIPFAAEMIGQGLTILLQKLIDSIPMFLTGLQTMLVGFIDLIVMIVPKAVDAILFLITSLLTKLAESIPAIVQAGFDILIGFLTGIANNIGLVTEKAIEIVVNFINAIASKLPDIIDAGWKLIISFVDGLTASVEENLPTLMTSTTKLGIAIVEGIAKGIRDSIDLVLSAIGDVGNTMLDSLKALLGIKSPSTVFAGVGVNVVQGFANGIDNGAMTVYNSIDDLAKGSITTLGKSIAGISSMVSDELNVEPQIRPVIDLTDIVNGSQQIDDLLDKKSLNVALSTDKIAKLSSGIVGDGNVVQNGSSSQTPAGTTVSLVQNNYSPKALSRLEIYRQTRNQLTAMRRLAGTA